MSSIYDANPREAEHDYLKNNNPSLILQRQGQVRPFTLLKHFSDTTNPSRRGSHHNNNTGAA